LNRQLGDETREELRNKYSELKRLLSDLAKDQEFHEDLKKDIVDRALKHWTDQARLEQDEAEALQDNYLVMGVFNKLKPIQRMCRQLGLGFPLREIQDRFGGVYLVEGEIPEKREEEEENHSHQHDHTDHSQHDRSHPEQEDEPYSMMVLVRDVVTGPVVVCLIAFLLYYVMGGSEKIQQLLQEQLIKHQNKN